MKKYLLLITVVFASCAKTPDEKAKALINEEMRKTLHDFKSYEPVEYSKLDSAFSDWNDVPEFAEYGKKAKEWGDKLKTYGDDNLIFLRFGTLSQSEYKSKVRAYTDSAVYYVNLRKQIIQTTPFKFKGWEMSHSFRAKNLSGNTRLATYKYYFDDKVTKIIKVIDPSESKTEE